MAVSGPYKGNTLIPDNLLRILIILLFDLKSAKESAKIESELRKQGKYTGGADILIAGTMIAHRISRLVTRNVKHFNEMSEIVVDEY